MLYFVSYRFVIIIASESNISGFNKNSLSYKYVVRGSLYIMVNLHLISRTTLFIKSILGVNINSEMSGKLNYTNCI